MDALFCPLPRSASSRPALWLLLIGLLAPTAAQAEIQGFNVNSIEGADGLELDDRFGTGSSDTEHRVNFEDCLLYNGESTASTGSTSAAVHGGDHGADADAAADTMAVDHGTATDPGTTSDPGVAADTTGTVNTGTLGTSRNVDFDVAIPTRIGSWEYAIKIGACDVNGSLTDAETETCRYIRQRSSLTSFHSIKFSTSVRLLIGTRSLNTANTTDVSCETLRGNTGDNRILLLIQSGDDTTTKESQEIIIDYDYDPPASPTDLEADPGEGSVRLSWSDSGNDSETDIRYRVYYSTQTFTDSDKDNVMSTSTTAAKERNVSGLDQGGEYTFRVAAIDDFDNESSLSSSVSATPVPVLDFFEQYKALGGTEEGGFCATGGDDPSAPWALLLLCGALLIATRRRGATLALAVLAAGALALAPADARATEGSLYGTLHSESPLNWTLNLRFGTYTPEIDNEFPLDVIGPWEGIFENESLWLFRVETGYLVTDIPGSVFVTGEVGFGIKSGRGIEVSTGEQSGDSTKMHFVPLSLGVMYQMDLLERAVGFPVIPYGRAGLTFTSWWITDGQGDTAGVEGPAGAFAEGRGGTWGYYFGGGLRLLLDVFSPDMAHDFDVELGFNNSYVFAEITRSVVDDFGSATSFILSDTLLSFGLGFDF